MEHQVQAAICAALIQGFDKAFELASLLTHQKHNMYRAQSIEGCQVGLYVRCLLLLLLLLS